MDVAGSLVAIGGAYWTMYSHSWLSEATRGVAFEGSNLTEACTMAVVAGIITLLTTSWMSFVSYDSKEARRLQIIGVLLVGGVVVVLLAFGAEHAFRYHDPRVLQSSIVKPHTSTAGGLQQRHSDSASSPLLPLHPESRLAHAISDSIRRALPNTRERKRWDRVQRNLPCCGVVGYQDWLDSTSSGSGYEMVPASCCLLQSNPHFGEMKACCQVDPRDNCFGSCEARVLTPNNSSSSCTGGSVTPVGCLSQIHVRVYRLSILIAGLCLITIFLKVISMSVLAIFLCI
ncbi:uncharacterized protein LOC124162725 isoform X2 [Ischnura elegans]|nr:uncharacterized protein LOC124162725 isoform X2 [Ischnura elegans]